MSFARVFRVWSPIVAVATFVLTAGLAAHGQVVNSNNWATVQPILARNVVNIATPPTQAPHATFSTRVLGIPAGVDYAFTYPSSASGTTFVIYVPAGVAASNNNKIAITGTSGAVTAQTTLTLNIP